MTSHHGIRNVSLTRRPLVLALVLATIGLNARAGSITTTYTYDAGDHVTSVTDPRGLVTSYTYDGLGQLWQQSSPDTGVITFSYDANGRRTSMTRAGGTQTTYAYDGIGRVTSISAGGQTQTFTYDTCTNGIGRLCSAADAGGSVGYSYTPQGWVTGRAFVVGSTQYALGYSYNAMGQETVVAYPDGNQALYSYTNGAVSSVSLNVGGTAVNAASNITYQPQDSAMSGWNSSNGLTNTLSYDNDGRLTGINVPNVQSLGFIYDTANRITQLTNGITPGLTQTFGYDDQSRLISVYSGLDNESYQYDANGNRIAQTVNGASQTATYGNGSNQLASTSAASYGYDAQGNLATVNGVAQYQYNSFNRLVNAGGSTYYVDPEGQRLMKTVGGASSYFAPDAGNSLFAENNGGVWTDYVWLNGRLIGRISAGQVQAIHVDQVGRPEAVTDASQAVVWRAQNLAFTRNVTVSNGVTLNIGLPGQYHDAETGLWNNGYRDYFDAWGRYVESDPTGLVGGINTYAYGAEDPLDFIDPLGLRALTSCERKVLSEYFQNKDLSKINIKQGIPWLARKFGADGADAWTFKNTIYMASGIDAPDTIGGISLIGHEVVHTTQYDQYGAIGFGRRYNAAYKANKEQGMSDYDAYRNNPFEVAGFDMGSRILNDLKEKGGDPCDCTK